ncbi:Oxidase ustYa [Colletotrichum spinosum]|uniref:Oxidase ustYa n=1 Tax=Colletotrichum spinosum TaxID=1347390 RepID=A0A4R8Q877_9PEZI|nr:Oxidase ustYa [Colletotrichum spinosum]
MINRDQAAKLVNKTVPVANAFGDYDGTYVVMLGVFHQLHCVTIDGFPFRQNLLRKSLYKDKPWPTDPDDPFSLMHLEHCIDALRQAVMCSADVTPHPWVWKDGQNREVADVMHSCRNFDAIRDWARPRDVFERGWNKSIRVPDPLQSRSLKELAASSADDPRNQCGRGDICNAAFFIPAYPSEGLLVNAAAAEVDDIARHLFTIV